MARSQVATAGVLLAVAAAAWAAVVAQMAGMGAMPWASPEAIGPWTETWVVMMAAMMLPGLVPAVVRARQGLPVAVFVAGFLAVWTAAGLLAYGLLAVSRPAGQLSIAIVLLAAAVYELTPLKRACLRRCCCPAFQGPGGALREGLAAGGWCLGCCWALMAALLALGMMSLTWMVVVAAMITAGKLLPARRLPQLGAAVVLAGLAVATLAGAPLT